MLFTRYQSVWKYVVGWVNDLEPCGCTAARGRTAGFSLAAANCFRQHASAILLPTQNNNTHSANTAVANAPVLVCLSAAMRVHRTLILLTLTLNIVYMDARLRRGVMAGRFACYDVSAVEDEAILKRAAEISNYVFVGRVKAVKFWKRIVLYEVSLRRVIKGDLEDVGVKVPFRTTSSLRFSGASVLVESSFQCRPIRTGMFALFLTERSKREASQLALVVEPVLLTLRSLERIEAAIRGESDT